MTHSMTHSRVQRHLSLDPTNVDPHNNNTSSTNTFQRKQADSLRRLEREQRLQMDALRRDHYHEQLELQRIQQITFSQLTSM